MTTLRAMIWEERSALDALLEEAEGEYTPEIAALWEELEGRIEAKVEATGLWVKRRQADAAAITEEVHRLEARRDALVNACQRAKDECQRQMEAGQIPAVKGVLCSVSIADNPPGVVGEIPPETLADAWAQGEVKFVRHVPASFALDKKAVIAAHKAGEPLPDGVTVTRSKSLRIR